MEQRRPEYKSVKYTNVTYGHARVQMHCLRRTTFQSGSLGQFLRPDFGKKHLSGISHRHLIRCTRKVLSERETPAGDPRGTGQGNQGIGVSWDILFIAV